MIDRALLTLAASLAAASTFAQYGGPPAPRPTAATSEHHQQPAAPTFRVVPLAGGVHALHGRGGNVGFLVGSESVIVVDSQFKDVAPGIIAEIQKVTDKPIRYLINTHHHGDHVGGNASFRGVAIIVAHDNVRTRMLAQPQDVLRDVPAQIEEAKKAGNAEAAARLTERLDAAKAVKIEEIPAPVLTFDSELRIHAGAETVGVWHTPPSHTDGDAVVYFEKANVLHMGDNFFHKIIPVIDVRSGGTPRGFLDAIDKVIARVPADVTIIPGHGEVTDIAGLKAFRQFFVDLIEAAKKAKAAGKTREQFLAEVDLPQYKDYGGQPRFKGNCGAAYDELQ